MIFYTYIRKELVRIFIISLILNEISYGKRQIPHHYLRVVSIHAVSFPHNLEQRLKVFARGCVENCSALHKTLHYAFAAYEDNDLHIIA